MTHGNGLETAFKPLSASTVESLAKDLQIDPGQVFTVLVSTTEGELRTAVTGVREDISVEILQDRPFESPEKEAQRLIEEVRGVDDTFCTSRGSSFHVGALFFSGGKVSHRSCDQKFKDGVFVHCDATCRAG